MFAKQSYQFATDIFLRLLGVVYLIAIYSLWTQIHGLIGVHGILPLASFLERAATQLGSSACFELPTLFWWFPGDTALDVLCISGIVLSVMLILGLIPLLCTASLWAIYLSLTVAGQTFLAFQWDNLLLETGLLAILLSPPVWRSRPRTNPPAPRFVILLLYWLLFRLMFSSGFVKLASRDESWWDLTALTYHFWTQPLPVWIAWYANQLPLWILKSATAAMFAIELVVPFTIFLPRVFRYAGFGLLVLLQCAIFAAGNYGFFNLLTVVLCIPLLDDRVFTARSDIGGEPPGLRVRYVMTSIRILVGSVIVIASLVVFASTIRRDLVIPRPVAALMRVVMPFRSVNSYGLFAAMTKSRPEIIIEGSMDGQDWMPYEFQYKPGDIYRTPLFTAPHMPRLDWQMWFAALGTYQGNPWLVNFMGRLLEGEPDTLALLETNPFPTSPPKMIRAVLYSYSFSTREQYRKHYLWWNRELRGLYCPVLTRSP